ncbi:His Kinase A (phospho-acceptor) domain-containing protein [Methylomagnum ishizawai]|uniref:histidine kinase n=1 Tax=Methylomagnum ishizawai TaxID=1760988 RepID=A0A1Y6D0X6_9GAMM|nr:PAS domain S-box protein [Methylomagnum ishizawai]SMF94054.1 His Kinase A (phospho-acceptor) domain-containing protein [Methylomagnum ishizawai]
MFQTLLSWFFRGDFLPHGNCLIWSRGLIELHVISDALTGLAYYSIPFGLAFFVRRRTDLVYRWMFILFASFILACGTTHFFDIWVLWHPDYAVQGILKAVTAAVSVCTAILLWPVLRRALYLPSPAELARINARLEREIACHREAVAHLEAEAAGRRLLEEKLRRNEARLRAILDTAVEGIVTIDDQGVIELCNPAAAQMFGYTVDELLGRNVNQLMPQPLREAHDALLAKTRISSPNRSLSCGRELSGLRKNGSVFPVEIAVGGFDGGGLHFTGILRDISERKALEDRLQQQRLELLHVHRLTVAGELAATMAHELNQPLGAIANYLGGAKLRFRAVFEDHPRLAEAIDETLRLSQRAAEVVHGIRDLVRRRETGRDWVAVEAVVDAALAVARQELARRKIAVVRHLPAALPPVWGQRVHLQQVLLNLMLNAMEAMEAIPPERRRLAVSAGPVSPTEIEIAVADTGPGFSDGLAGTMFEPFVSTKAKGIGLGLSICRTIAEAHGGHIVADSVPDAGAVFKLVLPTGDGRSGA